MSEKQQAMPKPWFEDTGGSLQPDISILGRGTDTAMDHGGCTKEFVVSTFLREELPCKLHIPH